MDQQNQSQQPVPGEASITPPMQQQAAPELTQPQGQQQINQKLALAKVEKEKLDFIFKGIATKCKAEFSSRIKNPNTIVQKVAQKRMAGRDYGLEDINDTYGARIIIKNTNEIPPITKMVEKAADIGLFKIKKSEMVKTPYHSGHHVDFKTGNGTNGELQILTAKEEANSAINHDLRAIHGEPLKGTVKQLADLQAKKATALPHKTAHNLAQVIAAVHKPGNDAPMPPQVNAGILASIKGSNR